MEFTLLWAALTGIGFGWLGTRLWNERLPDRPTDRLIGAAAVGLIVGRLTAMILQGINPIAHPLDIIIVRGGVHTGAAVIGAVVGFLWADKWRLMDLDAIAPAALFALSGWHLGCVWRGACLGTVSDLPWAWAESTSSIARHPVEIYAAIGFGVAAWLVSKLSWRLLRRAGSGLAIAGCLRLFTEPMRPSITGGPVAWYVIAIVIGLVVALYGARLEGRFAQTST